MHEKRFDPGKIDKLRSAERIGMLEIPRTLAMSLENHDIQSILDVGTGSGLFAEAFSLNGKQVSAIDINHFMLQAAHRYSPDTYYAQAEMEAIPFADRSFDLVFLGLVLHETDHPVQVLKEAARLAKKRIAIYEWPYIENPQSGPPLEHRLSSEAIQKMAVAAGLKTVEIRPFIQMVMYRIEME